MRKSKSIKEGECLRFVETVALIGFRNSAHIIQRTATLIGWSIFLLSIFFPFYSERYFPMGTEYTKLPPFSLNYYWSFKIAIEYHSQSWGRQPFTVSVTDNWFYEQEFYDYIVRPRISLVLLLILEIQVLTLATAMASMFFDKTLRLFPLITCSLVVGLMTFVSISPSQPNVFYNSYQSGYWLAYVSLFMFLLLYISPWFRKLRMQ